MGSQNKAYTQPSRPTSSSSSSSSSSTTNTSQKPNGNWATDITIDDADVTFDGEPLSALYEKNRDCYMQGSSCQREEAEERGRKKERSGNGS